MCLLGCDVGSSSVKVSVVDKETGTMNEFRKKISAELTFMSYAPSVFISALTGKRAESVIDMAKYVAENRAMRVPTGQLNSLITDATMMRQPPSDKGKNCGQPPLAYWALNR